MQKTEKLTKAEIALAQIAINEAEVARQQSESVKQQRLAAITETHGVPQGIQVRIDTEAGTLTFDDGSGEPAK